MTLNEPHHDPVAALANSPDGGVLAIIVGIDGPSYRPLGAMMAILADGIRIGTLSSGCIESDIALHAEKALQGNKPMRVLYGRGSPFLDIKLPCGGGLEILLLPHPDPKVLQELCKTQQNRLAVTLCVNPGTGVLAIQSFGETGFSGETFQVRLLPETFFYVFGKGPEASTFAGLVQSAGFPNLLLSPDTETLDIARASAGPTRHLKRAEFPDEIVPDLWSAVILFFHDHEWEPPILQAALNTPAFYIGAQGSRRARDLRLLELQGLGVADVDLERLSGPIGLVPSARDARTLAVSVLAEILATSYE